MKIIAALCTFVMPPLEKKVWRIVSMVTLFAVVAFFAISAYHHTTQYFTLAANDLSVARNVVEAKRQLGMIDAVHELLLHNTLKDTGLYDATKSMEVVIFELRLSLAIGVINGLMVLAMLFSRRRKAIALFLAALWTLGLTTALVLASPDVMGATHNGITCNCTGLEILDVSNTWAELGRNGVIMIALLWMAFAWAAPKADEPSNG